MKNINLHCPQVREEPSSRYKDEMFFNFVYEFFYCSFLPLALIFNAM